MRDLIGGFARESLALRLSRKPNAPAVIDVLSDRFLLRGVPGPVRPDNGPAFVATALRDRIAAAGAGTASVEPGSPGEGGGSGNRPRDC